MPDEPVTRIGCGSAYGEDRLDLAVDMVCRGGVDYLGMDGLAERTLAMAQLRRLEDPDGGFDLRMERFAEDLVPAALENHVTVVANMGAANPEGAAELVAQRLRKDGTSRCRLAVVHGDDVRSIVESEDPEVLETGRPVSELDGELVSANAYTGADAVVEAIDGGANIILGGRLADPSLFVGPLRYELDISATDWDALGQATVIGHMLECGAHVTGGNFADPPFRVVESFRRPSMPLADVRVDGSAVIRKLDGSDGLLSLDTCKAQLAYEIGDPANYFTPDVTADFRNVTLQTTDNGVIVSGARGSARPDELKVLIGLEEGFVGEGQISWAGPGAYERARYGEDLLRTWIDDSPHRADVDELRFDLLGINSLHGDASPQLSTETTPYEVHLRVAARSQSRAAAAAVSQAAEYIQLYGPAATGGHRKSVRRLVGMYSVFLPRELITTGVTYIEA